MTTRYSDEEILSYIEELYHSNGEVNTTTVRNADGPTNQTISSHFGSLGKARSLLDLDDENTTECSDCGGLFTHLGKHTSQSECSLPELSKRQKEIVVGVLMGDGTISEKSNSCEFAVGMVTEEFIEWLQLELQPFSSKISVRETENRDLYRLTTTPHKYFEELRDWYESGEKRYPNDLSLTPLILKTWYVTDGTISNGYPRIAASNESDRPEYLCSLFNDLPFDVKFDGEKDIQVDANDTEDFFNYIGSPPPGFEYKWS